ncbi:SHOCT domain-containing protein [Microbacterium sp. ARD31]|uniref:SHOCT domain-containing protein n=1 Tax=Microbacterium sp. ARD31 TaxID=2962576 RepID=UPI00288158C2|nr:SHOCT domain-containing protein [Microbacterium sp. ARD31]MDT0179284.1 SHOCT domain-containing protein [Microbacterium sp. ARD31]
MGWMPGVGLTFDDSGFVDDSGYIDDGVIGVPPGMDDGGFMDPTGMDGMASGFSAVFGLVLVLGIVGAVFGLVIRARKYRILSDAGIDPLTVDAQIAAKVLRSDALAPAASEPAVATPPAAPTPAVPAIEQRLIELDGLRARGIISDEEHREARAAVLKG